MINAEQHKQGQKKAKEPPPQEAYQELTLLGHSKASATHEPINALHTILMDIPLQTGFSYWRWKKGINVMLEKITGNCEATKPHIILPFEADFNQLNKLFLGRK